MESDAQLVTRVRLGDVEAFGQLAARYERSLLGLALTKLRDFHEAEDVVQATLLRAFRRLQTLRDGSKFGPWLIQIAQSQIVERARACPFPPSHSLDDSSHIRADDRLFQSWIDNEQLLGLVARLPEHERVLVGLRYFDGPMQAAEK